MPRRNATAERRTGRILPHQRDTNDDVPIIGADIQPDAADRAAVRATKQKQVTDNLRRDYRNRIMHIVTYLKDKYPTYCDAGGVRRLSAQELNDPDQFWHRNTFDLKYEGMNVTLIEMYSIKQKKISR